MKTETLSRTHQCKTCPWIVGSNVNDIPNYRPDKHENLKRTIATPGQVSTPGKLNIMACHHSTDDEMHHCVGWLHHQLGVGNNIPLRIAMLRYSNAHKITVHGEQHQTFEDTLPKTTKP